MHLHAVDETRLVLPRALWRHAQRARRFGLPVAAAALLAACAGERTYGEREILAELAERGVARPGGDGEWEAVEATEATTNEAAALPEAGVTLADLLRVAEARNASLAAARSEAGVAAGQAWQAWMYPNPRVEVEGEAITFGDGAEGAEVTVGVSQPIVLSGRREAAVRAAEAERDVQLAEADASRLELFGAVSLEHARLVSLREQMDLQTQLRDLISRTLDIAQKRVDARAAPESELLRVRVELKRMEAAAARLAREAEAAERRLSALLGGVAVNADLLAPVEAHELALEELDFAALERAMRASHPSLTALELAISAAEARLERARESRLPDLEVRAAVGYSDGADDGIVEVGAGMEVPLWDRRQGEILAERFAVMRARQLLAAEAEELVGALAEAVGEYEVSREDARAQREGIVPDAQRAFELTRAAYEGGRASFLDVFDAQRTLVEARVELAEATGRAAAARASIGRITGALAGTEDRTVDDEKPNGGEQ